MRTNRLLTRAEAAALDLPARIALERRITDAKAATIAPRAILPGWTFEHYRDRFPWRAYLFDFLGPVTGQTVLDLGCGYHPTPIYFALSGARKVYACDVSPKAIAYVEQMAVAAGVADRIEAIVCAGEDLPLPDGSVDLAHGEAVLHHLRLPLASAEIFRVLRRGGRGGFKDPLGHNPLLELARDGLAYGWKNAEKGTDRPLTCAEIERFGQPFSTCAWRGFGLLSMPAVLLFGPEESLPQRIGHRLDRHLLQACPWLQRWCRFVVTCVEK
jgi:SAM-dependent methyltransferase